MDHGRRAASGRAEREIRFDARGAGEVAVAGVGTLPRSPRAFGLAGASIIVFALWIGGGLGGAGWVRYVDDLATAAAALTATALCAGAAIRQTGRAGAFWWLFAGTCGAWALGELIWAFYDLVLGNSVPIPSWADAAYLAAIPLAAAALLAHPAMRSRTTGRLRSVLDGLVIAAALFFLTWTLILEPLRHTFDLGTLGGAVTLAYPLGDVLIVFLVLLMIRGTTSGARLDQWLLLGGILAITLSDSGFGYLTQVRSYATGNAIDIGWFAGYATIALAAYLARPKTSLRQPLAAQTLTSAAVITPFIPLLAALSLAGIRIQLGHHLDTVGMTTLVALVALFLARQALLLVDLWAPEDPQEAPVSHRLLDALGRATPDQSVLPIRPAPPRTR